MSDQIDNWLVVTNDKFAVFLYVRSDMKEQPHYSIKLTTEWSSKKVCAEMNVYNEGWTYISLKASLQFNPQSSLLFKSQLCLTPKTNTYIDLPK
jgi:hypothetical protein